MKATKPDFRVILVFFYRKNVPFQIFLAFT